MHAIYFNFKLYYSVRLGTLLSLIKLNFIEMNAGAVLCFGTHKKKREQGFMICPNQVLIMFLAHRLEIHQLAVNNNPQCMLLWMVHNEKEEKKHKKH